MCGIGGILRTDGQPIPEEWLDAIDARIAYRGPDGCGRFRDRVEIADANAPGGKRVVEVALVHRRLSIIDHASGGQPMVSARGRNESEGLVAVVFNGCIYNHRELRRELEGKGHRFQSDHSDTEVLIHGWREWGESLTEHLEGMYALAIWDRIAARLFMARDLFGEKPLYATWSEQPALLCAFGSSPHAVHAIASASGEAECNCASWLRCYLGLGFATTNTTPYCNGGVESVWPGCALTLEVGDRMRMVDGCGVPEPQEGVDEGVVESLLHGAVARRLEADVPLGCFLSGGVDSSLVSLFAKRHKPDVQSFTVRMPDARYDESKYAEQVATHLGLDHHTLDVAISPAEDLVHLIDLLGQPFGDSSLLPTHWVSKAARQHVKVALAGDGGDELFLGYERYLAARTLARHWRLLSRIPRFLLHRGHPKSLLHKLSRLGEMARDFPYVGMAAMQAVFSQREIAKLLDTELPQRQSMNGEDGLRVLRDLDLKDYLPNDLLRKVDLASMAVGLEVRCPFLDRDLARAALSMPIDQLMPKGQRKGLLRNIARKYLPRDIVDRPKMGFAIPIGEWFRNNFGAMKTLLLDHLNSAEPFGPIQLNRNVVQRFIDEHMSGKRDHGQRLFTLLTLSIWAKRRTEAQLR